MEALPTFLATEKKEEESTFASRFTNTRQAGTNALRLESVMSVGSLSSMILQRKKSNS